MASLEGNGICSDVQTDSEMHATATVELPEVAYSDGAGDRNASIACATTIFHESRENMKVLLYSRQNAHNVCRKVAVDINDSNSQFTKDNNCMTCDISAADIHVAALKNDVQVVKAVLSHGVVDDLYKNYEGQSALVVAINSMSWDVVRVLLNSHQDVESLLRISHLEAVVDEAGGTALHVAARHNQEQLSWALMQHSDVDIGYLDNCRQSALAIAINHQYWDIVTVFLNSPRNILKISQLEAVTDECGGTVLHVAARQNQVILVRALIEEKVVDVIALDNNGQSAIEVAIIHESWDVVREMWNSVRNTIFDSCLEALKLRGETLLHLAARVNQACTVQAVLKERSVDPGALDNQGRSALVVAINSKSWNSVNALVNSRKDIVEVSHLEAFVDESGGTVLHVAARHNCADLAKLVLLLAWQVVDVGFLNREGHSALAVAINSKSWEVVNALLHKGILLIFFRQGGILISQHIDDVTNQQQLTKDCMDQKHIETFDSEVQSITMGMINEESSNLVVINRQYILQVSHLESVVDECGGTVLHIAARHDQMALASALLEQGVVDVFAVNCRGQSALEVSTSCRSWKVAELLMDSPQVQARYLDESHGGTLLHVAARTNDVKLAEAFVSHRAINVGVVDNDGRSALVTAMSTKSWNVARLLLNNIPDIIHKSHIDAALNDDGETILHQVDDLKTPDDIIDRLIELGAELSQTDFLGNTTIHSDCSRLLQRLDGHSSASRDVIRRLMNVQNIYRRTPLHCAFTERRTGDARILLTLGADINIKDHHLKTPLHCIKATVENITEFGEIIQYLTSCKDFLGQMSPLFWVSIAQTGEFTIDTNYRDYQGNTALHALAEVYTETKNAKLHFFLAELLLTHDYSQLIVERNGYGQTPLHTITWKKFRFTDLSTNQLVKLLSYFSVRDDRGRNVWHLMFIGECKDISIFTHSHNYLTGTSLKALNAVDVFGRTPLHYAAMRETKCKTCQHEGCFLYSKCCLELFGVDCLRATDKYGRTALHYAYWNDHELTDEISHSLPSEFSGILQQQLAQTDIDGFTPTRIRLNRPDLVFTPMRNFERTMKSISTLGKGFFHLGQISKSFSTAWCAEHIFLGQEPTVKLLPIVSRQICVINSRISRDIVAAVMSFMERLVDAIGEEDQRLKGRLLAVGSAFEQTRMDAMDEFDFNVVLVNVNEQCDVMSTAAAGQCPPGFIQLTRKQTVDNLHEYQEFFNEDGSLCTPKLNFAFQSALLKVLSCHKFWETEPMFELESNNISYHKDFRLVSRRKHNYTVNPTKLYRTIHLRFNRPVCGRFIQNDISIDVVPVIHIPGWWPAGDREVDDDIKSEGCNFVFDQPYQKYRVPFSSTQYVKISFARAESIIIRKYPVRRAAYIVAKSIRLKEDDENFPYSMDKNNSTSFVLKTAALWSSVVTEEVDFSEAELLKQVEMLFAKLYEFAQLDYVPSYFFPAQQFPVFQFEKFVKHSQIYYERNHMNYDDVFPPLPD